VRSAGLTNAEIRILGWKALIARLGSAGALRFALLPPAAYRDPREPGAVYVRLSIDPRRADISARDVEAALARLR